MEGNVYFSDKEQVFTTGRKVKSEVGDVSILINNAGIVNGKKLLAIPDHMIEKTFNVNLLGQFWVRHVLMTYSKIPILRPPLRLSKSGLKYHFWTVPQVDPNQRYAGCRK